jgi:hypothetical protein
MSAITHISVISIPVGNPDRARDFYAKTLLRSEPRYSAVGAR